MWWTIVPSVIVTLAVVLIPGFAVNWACGLRPRTALGLAPLSSVGLVSGAAVVAGLVGVAWGPLPVIIVALIAAAVVLGLRVLLGRRWPVLHRRSPDPAPVHWGWLVASGSLAGVLLTIDSLRMLGSPTNFSQTYDNVFHLNLVQWMVQHRTGSVLELTMTGSEAFYPAAWHDLASLTLLTMGSHQAMVATNALIIVTVAVIWPLSCLSLISRVLPPSAVGTVGTGVLVASFGAFPYLLVGFGVLYPNLLALCLLPSVLALAVGLLDLGEGPRPPVLPAVFVGILGMGAVTLAHPNATVTLICVLGPVVMAFWALPPVARALRGGGWTKGLWWRVAAFVGWLLIAGVAFIVLRPVASASVWGPPQTFLGALIEAATVSPLVPRAIWVATLLTLVGIVAVIWTGRQRWLLTAHLGFCFLWLVGGAEAVGPLRLLVVGPWYNDAYRLAAMLPITAVPLAAFGLTWLSGLIKGAISRGRETNPNHLDALIAVVACVLLVATTQFSPAKSEIIEWVRSTYEITPDSPLVDTDEFAVLQMVEQLTDPDDVIAVNPWTGASMAYALTGRQTTAVHVTDVPNADTQILIDRLSAASEDPEVCPAIDDLSVDWVLDFGNDRFINNENRVYPGWYGLADNPGFELVFQQGNAGLYRVIACE